MRQFSRYALRYGRHSLSAILLAACLGISLSQTAFAFERSITKIEPVNLRIKHLQSREGVLTFLDDYKRIVFGIRRSSDWSVAPGQQYDWYALDTDAGEQVFGYDLSAIRYHDEAKPDLLLLALRDTEAQGVIHVCEAPLADPSTGAGWRDIHSVSGNAVSALALVDGAELPSLVFAEELYSEPTVSPMMVNRLVLARRMNTAIDEAWSRREVFTFRDAVNGLQAVSSSEALAVTVLHGTSMFDPRANGSVFLQPTETCTLFMSEPDGAESWYSDLYTSMHLLDSDLLIMGSKVVVTVPSNFGALEFLIDMDEEGWWPHMHVLEDAHSPRYDRVSVCRSDTANSYFYIASWYRPPEGCFLLTDSRFSGLYQRYVESEKKSSAPLLHHGFALQEEVYEYAVELGVGNYPWLFVADQHEDRSSGLVVHFAGAEYGDISYRLF